MMNREEQFNLQRKVILDEVMCSDCLHKNDCRKQCEVTKREGVKSGQKEAVPRP